MDLGSVYLEHAVNQFASLPGIGRRTAMRLVLQLLNRDHADILNFAHSLEELVEHVHHCKICHNLTDNELCSVCSNPRRDHTTVCVVESIQEVIAIESTQQYQGVYHVLGGIISPMEGIGPQDLEIASLVERVAHGELQEVILALSPTMEGDTTSYYIYRKLADANIKITTLARGVAQNDQLQYTDELTLGRSILDRRPFTT